jgi:hypothetical protein
MFVINGQEFDDNDITAVALELTGHLTDEQMSDLIGKIALEWRKEAEKGAALMIREGDQSLSLGHISDCVMQEDGHAFIDFIQEHLGSI